MSTLPDSTQKRKLNVSMMLKVPINLEIEVLGVPSTNCQQAEEKKEDKKLFNLIGDSKPEVIINESNLAKLDEDSQALVSQLVGQLEQTGKIFSTLSQTQHEQENPENSEQAIAYKPEYVNTLLSKEDLAVIQSQTPPHNKKIIGRALDSVNDGLTLVANIMGRILFVGKVANYSWE
ncbi:hypothetical protein HW132_33125 [Brasilonema sp. CT11]|nr:hypothetical protein [Brasilonema sp. CT11]